MSGKRGKNDAADAAAICEAVQRPNMRFVPVKSVEQQSQLMRAPRAPGIRRAAHRHHQPHPRAAQRVRHRAAAEGRDRAPPGRAPAWRICPAGPTPSSATCSASCTAWTSASRSTTGTSRRWRARTQRAQQLMRLHGRRRDHRHGARGDDRQRRTSSSAAGSSRPGSAWCRASTARAARPDSGASPRPATPTCDAAGPGRPRGAQRRQRTRPTAQPLGDGSCASAAATGGRWWPSRPRTRAWPGPC